MCTLLWGSANEVWAGVLYSHGFIGLRWILCRFWASAGVGRETHAAEEAWVGCWCGSQAWWGQREEEEGKCSGSRYPQTQIPVKWKPVKIAGCPWWLSWQLVTFSVSKPPQFVCSACLYESWSLQFCVSVINNYCFSSLFLAIPIYVSFAHLGGLKEGLSHGALKCWSCWSLRSFYLSWWEELFLAGKFPLGTEQCWLAWWDESGKMKLSSFSSCAIILRFFAPWCS